MEDIVLELEVKLEAFLVETFKYADQAPENIHSANFVFVSHCCGYSLGKSFLCKVFYPATSQELVIEELIALLL